MPLFMECVVQKVRLIVGYTFNWAHLGSCDQEICGQRDLVTKDLWGLVARRIICGLTQQPRLSLPHRHLDRCNTTDQIFI
jgi:hypothetical protein